MPKKWGKYFDIWRKTGVGMIRVNVYGKECGTGNRAEGDEPQDRIRKLTKQLVRAGGETK